jgi:hypothetical protein
VLVNVLKEGSGIDSKPVLCISLKCVGLTKCKAARRVEAFFSALTGWHIVGRLAQITSFE